MNVTTKFKALAIYQIAGGVIGLGLTVWGISKLGIIPGLLGVILFVAIALYLFSIYCGMLLLKKDVAGLNYSLVNQCLQLVSFTIQGFSFQYISGIYLSMGVDLTDSFILLFNFGVSSWQIAIGTDTARLIIVFNFVPLFLLLFLNKLKKDSRNDDAEKQIASLGQ